MKQLENVFYCKVCNCVFDPHGKVYEIKEHRNWKYINIDNKKVGVSSLEEKLRIFNFDDFLFSYVFNGLFRTFPCLAMDYYVYRKMTSKNISTKQYLQFIK
jgi:hypothetical protein